MRSVPRKRILYPAALLLPMAVMAAVFAACGLSPFGTRTMGVMDMAHQYLSFLYSLRDILTGRAGVLYLPSMCMGGNMIGVAAYYLTSPLNLITCLFPRESMYSAVSIVYLLRVGLCGLAMCIYADRRHGRGWRCLIPAMSYALMAYMLAYSFNYLWHDCVILLPIIALGIVRIIERKGPWLYIISLAAALFLNFYIGYILCIFSVLFFLYELLSVPAGERSGSWRIAGAFALSSLTAGALAAVILLPTLAALSGGKAEFSLSILTLTPKFDLVRMFSKLYPGAFRYEEIMPDGLPQIFTGTVTLTFAALYFVNRSISRRRRILTGLFLCVIVVSFWITAFDLIWHGFNTPSWYNYRYSFILSFLLAAAADRELVNLREGTRPLHLLIPPALCAVMSVFVFLGREYEFVTWHAALAAVLISAAASGAALILLRPGTGKRLAAVTAAALIILHAGELAVNAKLSLSDLMIPATDNAAYADYVSAKGDAFRLVDTGGTYTRVESPSFFDMNRCEPMLFGYDGISHYGSTLSQKSLDFLDRLGLDRYTDLWSMYGAGVTAAADSFLGIRYIVSDTLNKDYIPAASANGYSVYENKNALPIGWTADAAFAEPAADADCFTRLNTLYTAAAPEVGADVFHAADVVEIRTDNFTAEESRYIPIESGVSSVTYVLTMQADGPLYGEFSFPDFPGVIVFANDAFCSSYANAQTNGSLYLGNFATGDTVEVKLQCSAELIIDRAAFATEDSQALGLYHDALSAGGCDLEKLSSSHYAGAFTTGQNDTLLVLTMPYDPAWHVVIDGSPAQALEVQNCLMAFAVSPGDHTIELRYIPAGLLPGAVISGLTLIACAAVGIITRKRRAR